MHQASAGRRARAGFTLIDLMVALTIMVVAALVVIPGLSDDTRMRLMAASRVVMSDIEMAQVMTITNPQAPVIVKFDPDQSRYFLAYAATPDTPLKRSNTEQDYEVTLGEGRASSAEDVMLAVTDMDLDTLVFDAHGGVQDISTNPVITLSTGSKWIKLTIAPTTGTITETADND